MLNNINKPPRALVCYICGKEYKIKRIETHLGHCKEKWNIDQEVLEPELR
jgi:hypothetical protein